MGLEESKDNVEMKITAETDPMAAVYNQIFMQAQRKQKNSGVAPATAETTVDDESKESKDNREFNEQREQLQEQITELTYSVWSNAYRASQLNEVIRTIQALKTQCAQHPKQCRPLNEMLYKIDRILHPMPIRKKRIAF